MAPFEYVQNMSGKQVRSRLAAAFNHWLGIENDRLMAVMEMVEMLHNASLMIDDIEDNSDLRRGLPVAHQIYGMPRTINSANYVYFLALDKCRRLGHARAMDVFTEEMLSLHRGQGKEIFWRDTVHCPTEQQYETMVIQKTGGLFKLAVLMMQLFSENMADFTRLLELLAIFFQIRDDYANLWSQDYAVAKSYAEDLTEGKFSWPIIYAVNRDAQILNILRQRPRSEAVKKYCVGRMEACGAYEATRNRLKNLETDLIAEVNRHGANELLSQFINHLCIMHRS